MSTTRTLLIDADDTLWINEPYFLETENKFCALLEDYLPHHTLAKELFKTEIQNLPLYGYGVKGFMLSMTTTITLGLGWLRSALEAPVVLLLSQKFQ